jgi:ABC-type sugar transport system permease subunit
MPNPLPLWHQRENRIAFGAVLPALILVLGFFVYPVGFAVFISFTKSNGVYFDWRGLDNYLAVFQDPTFYKVLIVTLKFMVSVPLVVLFAVFCSVLLFEKIRGWRFFRVVFFLPSVLSAAVIGIMFRSLFAYYGPVNSLLGLVGTGPISFFVESSYSIWIIIFALVWSGFGYQSVLILSALNSIAPEVFEAAALDGAGWWRRLWSITLPNIVRVLGFVFIINVLYTFTSLFGFIFVMTAGGPGFETTSIDYLVYQKAFSASNLGGGAALAVVMFGIIGVLTLLQSKIFKVSEDN